MPKINVRMQSFKMADDIAQKDLFMRMVEAGMLSKHTMMSELFNHIDYDKEQQFIQEERLKEQQRAIQEQIAATNAQNMYGVTTPQMMTPGMANEQDGTQHGDLPEQNPPRAEGGNAQI